MDALDALECVAEGVDVKEEPSDQPEGRLEAHFEALLEEDLKLEDDEERGDEVSVCNGSHDSCSAATPGPGSASKVSLVQNGPYFI
jgi:hypothetical protein